MEYIFLGLIICVAVFVVAIIVRTLLFRPYKSETPVAEPIELDNDRIVDDMVAMFKC